MITFTEHTTFNRKAIKRVHRWIAVYNYLAKRWGYAAIRFNPFTMTTDDVHKSKMIPLDAEACIRWKTTMRNNILQCTYNRIFANVMKICK